LQYTTTRTLQSKNVKIKCTQISEGNDMVAQHMVIGAADNYTWSQLRNWVHSLNQSGFRGRKVILAYRLTDTVIHSLQHYGIEVYQPATDMFGRPIDHNARNAAGAPNTVSHELRFYHMWQLLASEEDVDLVVATDTRDVIFQSNPIDWMIENAGDDIIVPSEGIAFENEPWNAMVMQRCFGPHVWESSVKSASCVNVGTIAGPASKMRELFLLLYMLSRGCPYPADQTSLAFLMSLEKLLGDKLEFVKHDKGWACQCGTTADPQKIGVFRPSLLDGEPTFDGEQECTSYGIPYALVHQYDRVPQWAAVINERYNIQ
jgi:hypothetical protein